MMTSRDQVLFSMKKVLLEYGLRHNLDFLVKSIAMIQHSRFSDYKIPQIRFNLFNMYLLIKNKEFKQFDAVISFLSDLKKHFPSLIPDTLYLRVIAPIKALHIYDCLKIGDLKKACLLMKEYFPNENAHAFDLPADKSKTDEFEFKILKKRTHWNELILDRKQRETYFKNEFSTQYNNNFFAFLMMKTNEIIKIINDNLPETTLDQIINNGFKETNLTLFGVSNLNLELEDEVRIELFLDNMKLHHIHLISNKSTASPQDNSIKKSLFLNKYLKKLIKLVINWENQISNSDNSYVPQMCSQPASNSKVILEMLYMDSQMENIRIDDFELSVRIDEIFDQEKESTLEDESSLALRPPPSVLQKSNHSCNGYSYLNDLITDDER